LIKRSKIQKEPFKIMGGCCSGGKDLISKEKKLSLNTRGNDEEFQERVCEISLESQVGRKLKVSERDLRGA